MEAYFGGQPRTPENFRKFAKQILKKIAKKHYFSLLFKKIKNLVLNFRAFERKTQFFGNFFDENSIEKWNFISFLEKLLLKIET